MSSTMDPITPTRFTLKLSKEKISDPILFSVGLLVGFAVLSLLPVLLKNKLKDKFD